MTEKNEEELESELVEIPKSAQVWFDAITNETTPKIYINGFGIARSNSDISLVGQLNNRPVVVLNVSYTLAKSLVEKLGSVILEAESSLDHSFLTTDQLDESIQKR